MASTTTFTLTPSQVIFSALRQLGVIELGATPDTNTTNNALQVLNIILKEWQTAGLKIWTIAEVTFTPTLGKQSYVIAPSGGDIASDRPLRIIQAFSRDSNSNTDTPLEIVSKEEYNLLGNKTSTGAISTLFYDRGTTSGTLYTYNCADSYSATNTVVHLFAQRPIYDINLTTDPIDFPQEWMNALRWNLAMELMMEYGVPLAQQQIIQVKADKYRTELENWDIESTSTSFVPDMRSGMRAYAR